MTVNSSSALRPLSSVTLQVTSTLTSAGDPHSKATAGPLPTTLPEDTE
jgi:hypothetical protein